MKLIVGLGNPGKEYENTRHNVGFMALDNYVKDTFKQKDNYLYIQKVINGEKCIFVKPLTYMNESGLAVKKVMSYFNINIEDLLVIYDDVDFEVGTFKLKSTGSSGGHNGIKSIIKYVQAENFKRIRIGISKPKYDMINYVLGKFTKKEMEKLNIVFTTINNILNDFPAVQFDKLMSKYN